MEWVCVFRAGGPTEAWLVRDWLERNGVEVRVRGDLTSLRGEIPVEQAWPSVWVRADDLEPARAALRDYAAPRLVHPTWSCAACGEVNEPTFGSCWSCETDRP